MECQYCRNGKKKALLQCSWNDQSTVSVKLVNAQLDVMVENQDQGKKISYGQSNTINFCPMCGRDLTGQRNDLTSRLFDTDSKLIARILLNEDTTWNMAVAAVDTMKKAISPVVNATPQIKVVENPRGISVDEHFLPADKIHAQLVQKFAKAPAKTTFYRLFVELDGE